MTTNLSFLLRKQAPQVQKTTLCALLRKAEDLDHAAHAAATSPHNILKPPSEARIKSGNYKKGHVRFAGLDIAIENPAGSRRRPEWPEMLAHYGYIKGTVGADGDPLDVFIRPSTPLDWDGSVFVVDQVDADGNFDEHKVMLGYESQEQAESSYLGHYPSGWLLGTVRSYTVSDFHTWIGGFK